MGLAILFFYGLRGAIFRGLFPTTNIISHLLSSVKVELMFGYFLYHIRQPTFRLGRGNQPNRSPPKELGAGAARSARPPHPPTFYYIIRSCVLSSVFLKKYFFFFFFYISPFIISYFGFVCQVFFKNFFKKIFQIFLDFDGEMQYNYYSKKGKEKNLKGYG